MFMLGKNKEENREKRPIFKIIKNEHHIVAAFF